MLLPPKYVIIRKYHISKAHISLEPLNLEHFFTLNISIRQMASPDSPDQASPNSVGSFHVKSHTFGPHRHGS